MFYPDWDLVWFHCSWATTISCFVPPSIYELEYYFAAPSLLRYRTGTRIGFVWSLLSNTQRQPTTIQWPRNPGTVLHDTCSLQGGHRHHRDCRSANPWTTICGSPQYLTTPSTPTRNLKHGILIHNFCSLAAIGYYSLHVGTKTQGNKTSQSAPYAVEIRERVDLTKLGSTNEPMKLDLRIRLVSSQGKPFHSHNSGPSKIYHHSERTLNRVQTPVFDRAGG